MKKTVVKKVVVTPKKEPKTGAPIMKNGGKVKGGKKMC